MLETLGHKQSSIPLKIDNSTAVAYCNSTLNEKRSKAWDMCLYWIKDRITNKEFLIYWDKGIYNLADYFTKHFSPSYHQEIRPRYILKGYHTSLTDLCARVC